MTTIFLCVCMQKQRCTTGESGVIQHGQYRLERLSTGKLDYEWSSSHVLLGKEHR